MQVLTTSLGRIDEKLLNLSRLPTFQPMVSMAHASRRRRPLPPQGTAQQSQQEAQPAAAPSPVNEAQLRELWAAGRPARFISDSLPEQLAAGWLFPQAVIFQADAVLRLCNALLPVVARVKGVFRVGKEWVSVELDEARGCAKLVPLAYRRESRFEAILPRGVDSRRGAAACVALAVPSAGTRVPEEEDDWVPMTVACLLRQDWDAAEQLMCRWLVSSP